jgi:hypothetical protein
MLMNKTQTIYLAIALLVILLVVVGVVVKKNGSPGDPASAEDEVEAMGLAAPLKSFKQMENQLGDVKESVNEEAAALTDSL